MKSFFDDIVVSTKNRYRSLLKEDLMKFNLSVFLYSFAGALVGIFVPIYLYQIGYSIVAILLYYGIVIATHVTLIWPSARLALKWGSAKVNLMSIPFAIAFNVLLIFLPKHPETFALIAILEGIASAMYWFSFHFYFASLSFEENRSREYGFLMAFMQGASVAGPIAGGLLISTIGMASAFTIAAALLFLSAIPLFSIRAFEHGEVLRWREVFRGFSGKKFLAYYGYGVQMYIDSYLFAIFMFIVIKEIFTIGFITTITQVAAILFISFVGNLSDRHPKRIIIGIGAGIMSACWVSRAFLRNAWRVFVSNTFFKMSYTTVDIPMSAIYYNMAEKDRIARNILRREYGLHTGTLSACIFLVLLFVLSPYEQVNFMIAFFVGAVMILATLFF